MGWQCKACTFLNEMDDAIACQMCDAPTCSKTSDITPIRKEKRGTFVFGAASTETKRSRDRKSTNADRVQLKRSRYESANKSREKGATLGSHDGLKNPNKKSFRSNEHPVTKRDRGNGDENVSQTNRATKSKNLSQTDLFGRIVKSCQDEKGTVSSAKAQRKDSVKPRTGTTSSESVQRTDSIQPNHARVGKLDEQKQGLVEWNVPFPTLWESAMKGMREIFGIESLRNLQPVAIEDALKRKSQIIVMATGGGKSLCYQLPAVCFPGLTLVISPLIALMNDQVQSLNDKGVAAALISSSKGQRHNKEIMDRVLGRRTNQKKKKTKLPEPPLKPVTLLYCTPELVQTDRFRDALVELDKNRRLDLIAVDEAHCLSTWGHDFRPAYRKLSWLRRSFPHVPCMACTATATSKVIGDIRETLCLENAPCHMGTFNRKNISYQVRYKDTIDGMKEDGAMGDLIRLVKEQHALAKDDPCSGIIYVHKRKDTEMIAREITRRARVKALPYHAGLKDAERVEVQSQWTNGLAKIAVATVAFGMGIDLPHVRYVVHWTIAKSLEGFYQESGRAGRDGRPSQSVVYYSKEDASKFSYLLMNARKPTSKSANNAENALASLESMIQYCATPACRRQYVLRHFGEKVDAAEVCKQSCDFCQNPSKVEEDIRVSGLGQDFLSKAREHGQRRQSELEWNYQRTKPLGNGSDSEDVDETLIESWDECGLSIKDSAELLPIRGAAEKTSGKNNIESLRSAKQVLAKYETLECQEGKTNGFVNFRRKGDDSKEKNTNVKVPEHLRRSNLPDPLAHLSTSTKQENVKSSDLVSKAELLRAELKQLKDQKEAKLKAMKSTTVVPDKKLVAPSLAFKRSRK